MTESELHMSFDPTTCLQNSCTDDKCSQCGTAGTIHSEECPDRNSDSQITETPNGELCSECLPQFICENCDQFLLSKTNHRANAEWIHSGYAHEICLCHLPGFIEEAPRLGEINARSEFYTKVLMTSKGQLTEILL